MYINRTANIGYNLCSHLYKHLQNLSLREIYLFFFANGKQQLSLYQHFGRQVFQIRTSYSRKTLAATIRQTRMQKKILLIIASLYSFNIYCQTIEQSVDHYLSGKIYWQGQDICDTSDNGSKYCFPIGLWTYWHENGSKMLVLNHRIIKPKIYTNTLYQNMWLPDGTQILVNGNGIYYEDEPHGGGDRDSLVYQITDSIKHGPCKRYRLHKGGSYFLVGTGQYDNNRKVGKFNFRDTAQYFIEQETVYINDEEETSHYKYLHKNLNVKEEGNTKKGRKEGLCKFYNEKGTILKR